MATPSRLLASAIDRRRRAPAPVAPLDAHRWINGAGDGAPGLVIDRYAEHVVLQARPEVANQVDGWIQACRAQLEPHSIVLKTVASNVSDRRVEVVSGSVPEGPIVVREGDARFECLLVDGLQTGLFLDHRDTRQLVRRWCADVEVLNLFAYTGAFSVHAALAGAQKVTSVDSAKRALRWGRDNMRASGLDPDAHRWFADDVVAHLRRGDAGRYGVVILDPPVMGRAGGKTFSLAQQLGALVEGAVRKLASDGVLVLSTHMRRWGHETLHSTALAAAAAVGREVRSTEIYGLPGWDHPVGDAPGDVDRGDYLKTLVLRIA